MDDGYNDSRQQMEDEQRRYEETMKHIAPALLAAQKAYGKVLKNSDNPYFNSKYAKLENCIDAVITALNDNGITLIQKSHHIVGGVGVETVFLHESGEEYSAGTLAFPASKNDPQGFASAHTYARRYGVLAACGIAPEDDDGNRATQSYKDEQRVNHNKIEALIVQYRDAFEERDDQFARDLLAPLTKHERDAFWKCPPFTNSANETNRKYELSKEERDWLRELKIPHPAQ